MSTKPISSKGAGKPAPTLPSLWDMFREEARLHRLLTAAASLFAHDLATDHVEAVANALALEAELSTQLK